MLEREHHNISSAYLVEHFPLHRKTNYVPLEVCYDGLPPCGENVQQQLTSINIQHEAFESPQQDV